jgi:hypothetical protein
MRGVGFSGKGKYQASFLNYGKESSSYVFELLLALLLATPTLKPNLGAPLQLSAVWGTTSSNAAFGPQPEPTQNQPGPRTGRAGSWLVPCSRGGAGLVHVTLCYAIVLPDRKSAFRAGFWPDCYRESNEIGPPAGLRPAERPF